MAATTNTLSKDVSSIYATSSIKEGKEPLPMPQERSYFELAPLTGALGAEINRGIQLNTHLTGRQIDEIRAAFHEYSVLVFRNQTLTHEDLLKIAHVFGEAEERPVVKAQYGLSMVHDLVREPDQLGRYGEIFHHDCSYMQEPPLGAMLYGVEVPPVGNDTVFASMCLALESLSDDFRTLLEPLRGVHSAFKQLEKDPQGEYLDYDNVDHPVIRTHPETGRKALFVNPFFTKSFLGMTEEESRSILDYLFTLPLRPELQCRVRWAPGTLTIWDNRCTQHMAIRDYSKTRRVMRRVEFKGDKPV